MQLSWRYIMEYSLCLIHTDTRNLKSMHLWLNLMEHKYPHYRFAKYTYNPFLEDLIEKLYIKSIWPQCVFLLKRTHEPVLLESISHHILVETYPTSYTWMHLVSQHTLPLIHSSIFTCLSVCFRNIQNSSHVFMV